MARTENELIQDGFEYLNSSHCDKCGDEIAWFSTPKNKKIPLNEGSLEPHWETCGK
jgi:hypothetical protein